MQPKSGGLLTDDRGAMRAFVALMSAAGALVIGMWALSLAQSETEIDSANNTAGDTAATVLESISTTFSETLATSLPWLAVAAVTILGSGVLVMAARGR